MIKAWEDTVFPVLSRCESDELKSEPEALGGEWGSGQVSQVFRILDSLAKYQIILAKYQAILAIPAKYEAIQAKYQIILAKYNWQSWPNIRQFQTIVSVNVDMFR